MKLEDITQNPNHKPYTNAEGEYTPKNRLVYCKKCGYDIYTPLPGPRCGICDNFLIEVILPRTGAG